MSLLRPKRPNADLEILEMPNWVSLYNTLTFHSLFCYPLSVCPVPIRWRCLTGPVMTPAFGAYVRPYTHPHPPAPFVAPRAPRPSSAPRNRKVIPPETEPRGCYANQTAENEVKPKVAKVRKARATHVDGSADRNENENE